MMPPRRLLLCFACAIVAWLSIGAWLPIGAWLSIGAQAPATIAFVGVTLVPMDRERVIADQTLLVTGDRITAIGPVASTKVPPDATRIDAKGAYLMPGLGEMHGHLGPEDPGNEAQRLMNERILALNALKGITTIRGMLGHPAHLPLRERVRRGEVLGPTIYTSGPSFSGNSVKDEATAVAMVKAQKDAGYDFLKIHPGVPLAPFDALARTANEVKITFQGHVPSEVGLAHALELRYRAIDHLDGYVEALAGIPPGPQVKAGFFGSKVAGQAKVDTIGDWVKRTREAGTWIAPTEVVVHSFLSAEPPEETLKRPEMRYVPAPLRENWLKQKTNFNTTTGIGTTEERETFFALRRRLIKELHGGGVKLLLGADSPQVMSVPGVATHQELRLLVEAGLTPYQAIETGTRNVAEFFGQGGSTGTIEGGKTADLILVAANPLDDVTNASKIEGVVVRGRWIAKVEIEKRLEALQVP